MLFSSTWLQQAAAPAQQLRGGGKAGLSPWERAQPPLQPAPGRGPLKHQRTPQATAVYL